MHEVGDKVRLSAWGVLFVDLSENIEGMPTGVGEVLEVTFDGDVIGARFPGVSYNENARLENEGDDRTVIWFAKAELVGV